MRKDWLMKRILYLEDDAKLAQIVILLSQKENKLLFFLLGNTNLHNSNSFFISLVG